jgi:hypothetical protein
MDAEIRLLEDRVRRAVERIRALSVEKARLSDEVRKLRADLERAGRDSKRRQPEPLEKHVSEWADSLRQAIRELRGA